MSIQRLLVISLVANLICLGGLLWSLTKGQSPPAQPAPATTASGTATKTKRPEARVTERIVREEEPFHWSQIESDDYQTYVENLRRIGCPEETIRDLVKQDLDKFYDERKAEVLNSAPPRKDYWKTGHPTTLSQPSTGTRTQLAKLDQEKTGVLNELFGAKGVAAINRPSAYSRAQSKAKSGYSMDFIPEETKAELNSVEQEFGSKLLKTMASGTSDAEDRNEILQLREEREDRIASMLTPEQKLEYDLRKSPTAANLRLQLDGFEPSEDEFRDIFQARKQFDDQHGTVPGTTISAAEAEERRLAEQVMNDDLLNTLGEDRFQDYMRQTDYDYKSIAKVADRQGLNDVVSAQVYQMKNEAEELARSIRMDGAIPVNERQQQLQQILSETSRSIESLMGQQGAASLQAQGGGRNWLNNLGRVNPYPITKPTFQVITSGSPSP